MNEQAAAPAGARFPQLPLPKPFDGTAESWPTWRQRFERYRISTGLNTKTKQEQVSIFLYAMGDIADNILICLAVNEADIEFDELSRKFNEHFGARKNEIIARAKFNRRTQKQGEGIDAFIQDLHKMAEDCNYAALRDELIRDCIVVGVTNDDLSDDMQAKANLTLTEAIQMARQAKARKEGQQFIRGTAVDYVQNKHHAAQRATHSHPTPRQLGHKHYSSQSCCSYCGKEPHDRDKCPAKNATCLGCSKKGQYKAVCRATRNKSHTMSKRVQELTLSDSEDDFLGSIMGDWDTDMWTAEILVNSEPIIFKLDTGASVSVVGDKWAKKRALQVLPTSKRLKGPGSSSLKVIGKIEARLAYKDKNIPETIYIVKEQPHALLSREACVRLGMVARVYHIPAISTDTGKKKDIKQSFPQLFSGLIGKVDSPCTITLQPDARPVCLYAPRKIAHPLIPKVKQQIEDMVKREIISPVTEPTSWCSGIVVVPKPNGSVRICVDLAQLNKAVKREVHPMHSVDESLAQIAGSKIFSKLDAKNGFWQIPLNKESKPLTTFVTPFGRFHFNRLPFGISSASEMFQRTMTRILEGLDGVVCHMDDILIHAPDQTTHDERLKAVLSRLDSAGLTLNDKCDFRKTTITFLGHIIDGNGVRADPAKLDGIHRFPTPHSVQDIQRFLGMVNQLTKFTENLASLTDPLRQLLRKNTAWVWGYPQQKAFQEIKERLTSAPVLAHYDVKKPTIIASDASCSGIGAVLIQTDKGQRHPICYISRSLTEAEKNYATIEKEALAVTWACERLSEYVIGLDFVVETDHKPLVPLLTSTALSKMPPRIQRFRLRLMRYSPKVIHVAGKDQLTADALSRAPAGTPTSIDSDFIDIVTCFAEQSVNTLPASS
ncbi:hypothetical protein ACOMHN_063470 [Nucella lapillus]